MWKNLKTRRFFSARDKDRLLAAIQAAERLTSGEIRIHVESGAGGDPIRRAAGVFEELGMTRTQLRNGVLIYLAVKDRKFAIIGDRGIDAAVPENFWEETKELMGREFQAGRFVDGVCLGIRLAGERLAQHFPYRSDDVNELTDEISEGI
jgi:uncharacterized membrane protein